MKKSPFFIVRGKKTLKWSEDEDKLLLELVNVKLGKKWKLISTYFKEKSRFDCYTRYFQINPTIKKGKWTKEEDDLLVKLVEDLKYDWAKIANIMKNRTSKQIRSRYIYYLDTGLNKSEFTPEEDEIVRKLFPIFKTNWVNYVNYLPNRSAKIIQNRYRPYK